MTNTSRKTVVTVNWNKKRTDAEIEELAAAMVSLLTENFAEEEIHSQEIGSQKTAWNKRWTSEEILEQIRLFHKQNGRPPTSREFKRAGPWPKQTTVVKKFGSWANAIEAAGFPRPDFHPPSDGGSLLHKLYADSGT